jgi:hypothetical protein
MSAERTPERTWVAEAQAKLASAIEAERSLEQALQRARGIEQEAADAVEQTQHAAQAFAARLKQSALVGAEPSVAIPDDVRRESMARSRLTAASCALAEISADLESAKTASVEAARSLDRATASVLVLHAEALIAEALAAQQTVERVRVELYCIDRTGGSPGPGGVHQPFAFPQAGIALVRDIAAMSPQALGSSGVNVVPIMQRWQDFRAALKTDPDAEIA